MKNIIYIIFLAPLFLNSQCVGANFDDPCCNQQINIDPLNNNQYLVNNERTTYPNGQEVNFSTFDISWMNINTPFKVYDINNGGGTGHYLVNNPIFNNDPIYGMISNYHPLTHPTIEGIEL